jgi:hypothetical protein
VRNDCTVVKLSERNEADDEEVRRRNQSCVSGVGVAQPRSELYVQSRSWKWVVPLHHGGFHFTFQIIIDNNAVWYHDGQLGPNCRFENELSDFSETDLNSCGGRQISLIIYTQD